MPHSDPVKIKFWGLTDYESAYERMLQFNETPDPNCPEQIWVMEHHPVFTLGYSADEADILGNTSIPAIRIDRGGQVTYHGPGQLIIYPLLELKNRSLLPTQMVGILEKSVIEWLGELGIASHTDANDRGVYTLKGEKLASIGLRIRRGRSYHGIAINVAMDLKPFSDIVVCGKKDMELTSIYDIIGRNIEQEERVSLLEKLANYLNCTNHHYE